MFPILEIKQRRYPTLGIFLSKFRTNHYVFLEYEDDFLYYENTPLQDVFFDDKHSISWDFLSLEGLNYFLPRILFLIQDEIEDLSVSLSDFIINMTINSRLLGLLFYLPKEDLEIVNEIMENVLYSESEDIVNSIGEHYYIFKYRVINKAH